MNAPSGPKPFQKETFVVGIARVESACPAFDGGGDLFGRPSAQFAAGTIASAVFRKFEVFQQLLDAGSGNFGGLD